MKKLLPFVVILTLTACNAGYPVTPPYSGYLTTKGLKADQNPMQFEHCHGYGCDKISEVTLTETDWREIEQAFQPPPYWYKEERAAIAKAIAIFEQKAGEQTGTSADKWGTFRNMGKGQLDCVDEATNTTIYLMLLQQRGLIKYHIVESPATRFPIIHSGRWPHQTAVISETPSKAPYVVDSWFHDNGEPPEIVPLKQWKEGWKPDREDASSNGL